MEDNCKFKEALQMVESKYKCFDSTSYLIVSTQCKITELLKKEDRTTYDDLELATAVYTLKALSKLSIAESIMNAKNKRNERRWWRIIF